MKTFLSAVLTLALAAPALAQDDAWRKEMERKLDVLTREIENTRLGGAAPAKADASILGFGPAASKVYQTGLNRVSIGGYGEMLYERFDDQKQDGTASGGTDQVDFLRFITYFGYKFTDSILLNTEIEYEHANTGKGGEVGVEFAYLDFRMRDWFGVRAGLLLVPMGLVNELHEPTVFHGAKRPSIESNIIPTTWRENGAGVFGEFGGFDYRAYLLNAQHATGFSASSFIRGSRTKGSKSKAEDLAGVLRVDYKGVPGVVVGASVYNGQSGQGSTAFGKEIKGWLTMWEGHATAAWNHVEAKALYVQSKLTEAVEINKLNGVTGGNSGVGEQTFGGYLEVAYDVLGALGRDKYLAPFFRYERYDTQFRVPGGFTANPANDRVEYTYGATFKPTPMVAVKADWQNMNNGAKTGQNQFNLALGFIF